MHAYVYKSQRKTETYIYLARRDDFEAVPESVRAPLAPMSFVLSVELTPERRLAHVDAQQVRVSTLPLALPYIERVYPQGSFDMREMVKIHARGIAAAQVFAAQDDDERRRRAFMLTAEIFLMQHSCHWFCKSLTVASMRLLARHQTSYEQVLTSVSGSTRDAYLRLIGKR